MENQFFEKPVLNSPYDFPARHWELDSAGQPTQRIVESRRRAEFITPIPKPRKQKVAQDSLLFDQGLSTQTQETDARRCHLNWVILDSDWEAEFCRVAEFQPRVRAYVKNHNLGFEIPYRCASEMRTYLPDFIVLVDDGQGEEDLLHLIVEIKGYRREDAKEKKATMETSWVPGVNNLKQYGRWAFAEFTDVFQMQTDFGKKVEAEFDKMIDRFAPPRI